MSRMFREVTRTWSPITGCLHVCSYCWARRLAEGRLHHLPRYAGGFKPRLIPEELRRRFHHGLIFVSDMGDLFGDWVPREWIERVLEVVRESPKATFLFLTKNPAYYYDFLPLPSNAIAGVTIETNRYGPQYAIVWQKALLPEFRYPLLARLPHSRKMVSIEPVMNFDLEIMVGWMREIAPEFVYIGADNWNHHLPEPPLEKTQALIEALRGFTEVRLKTIRKAWYEDA